MLTYFDCILLVLYKKSIHCRKTSRKSNAATYKQKVLIANRIFDGLYKLVKNTEGKSPIWNVYSWIMEPDGTIIKDYIYCTKCLSVLKYDDDSRHVSNVKRHACAQKYWHVKPQETKTPDDSVNRFKEQPRTPEKETIIMATTSSDKDNSDEVRRVEISTNIYQGVYKLIMVKNRKSLVWKLFAMITKANGTLVKGYVYCTICSRLLAFDGRRTGSLKNHKCAKKHWKHLLMEAEETEGTTTKSRPMTTKQPNRKSGLSIKRLKTDENEIDDDSISLSDDCDNLQSYNEDLCVVNEAEDDEDDLLSYNNDQIGLKFEHIRTDNGSILDGVVRCCHCKMELEYKGSYKIQLNEHECVNETVLPIKMEFDEEIKSTGLECTTIKQEANDNLYCVKEEDEGEVNSTKSPIYLEEQYDSKEKLYLNTYETKSQAHDDTPYHYVIHELDESNNTYIKEEFKDF